MNNFLHHQPTKALPFVIIVATSVFIFQPDPVLAEPEEAQSSEIQELKMKVETLKRQVYELEATKTTCTKTKKSGGNRWDSLSVGLTKEEVTAILGKAGMVHKWKTGEAWYYPNPKGGEVDFDVDGKASGWLEP